MTQFRMPVAKQNEAVQNVTWHLKLDLGDVVGMEAVRTGLMPQLIQAIEQATEQYLGGAARGGTAKAELILEELG